MRSLSTMRSLLLTKCRSWITSTRARYFALYVVLLFVFAFIYWRLPGREFYHANVSREPMLKTDKDRILLELKAEIIATFQRHNGSSQRLVDDKYLIDAQNFSAGFLEAADTDNGDDVEIRFRLLTVIVDMASSQKRRLYLDPQVRFLAKELHIRVGDGSQLQLKPIQVSIPEVSGWWDKGKNGAFAALLFPERGPEGGHNNVDETIKNSPDAVFELTMPISIPLDDKIRKLANGIRGDPSALDGQFERMLYLSAVTITTLGFGDIAPLTTRARILITIEAVAGIIVIGLFIGGPKKGSGIQGPTAEPK